MGLWRTDGVNNQIKHSKNTKTKQNITQHNTTHAHGKRVAHSFRLTFSMRAKPSDILTGKLQGHSSILACVEAGHDATAARKSTTTCHATIEHDSLPKVH